MYVIVIFAFFSVGFLNLQTGYGSSSVWDVDLEIKGLKINGVYYSYADIPSVAYKSLRQITWDPDGNPTVGTDMNAPGMLPTYQISVGSLFFTNENGLATTSSSPVEQYIDESNNVHLIYYLGYSLSILTRGAQHDKHTYNFKYYEQTLKDAYKLPEFSSGSVGVEVGVRLIHADSTVPTLADIKDLKLTSTKRLYTAAESLNMPAAIDEFNTVFKEWGKYFHKGSITGATSSELTVTKMPITDSNVYGANVEITAGLDPGSNYWYRTDITGWGWIAGGFNLYDVECLTTYLVKLDVSYKFSADVNDYMQNRLDFVLNKNTEVYDVWYYIMAMLIWIANIFGFTDIWLAAIVLIIMIIIFIVILILLKKLLFGRARMATRLVYGY